MDESKQAKLARSVGASIAAMWLEADMTLEQLAEALGIGAEAVSRIERGAVMPTLPRLYDVAEVFGREVAELLLGASSRREDQARDIWEIASDLSTEDRELVFELVARLSAHLRERPAKRPRRGAG